MVNIHRFHFEYTTYPYTEISLNYNKGAFFYSSLGWPFTENNNTCRNEELAITDDKLKVFSKFLKTKCSHWKRNYEVKIMDGPMWNVKIHINDVKLYAKGNIEYPDNFDELLNQLSVLTEGKSFSLDG